MPTSACLKGQDTIEVVSNYSALPNPVSVPGAFYWVENTQGTWWTPGSVGGTFYNSGQYYSNGVSWTFIRVPYQAPQAVINAGTDDQLFITSKGFNDSKQLEEIRDDVVALATALS